MRKQFLDYRIIESIKLGAMHLIVMAKAELVKHIRSNWAH